MVASQGADLCVNFWVAYADLTDDLKEADRMWARKVIKLLHRRNLIP